MENSRPDLVVLKKKQRKCIITDVAYPFAQE